ncbi:MAG TPA: hypothetical protein PLU17_05180 [Chitinophagaceae bacterium]|nr:hypothetical protein [Chitinophagaceae bacterium]
MKRLVMTIFIIAVLNSILESFLPWWILVIISFVVCLIARLSSLKSFFAGFMGIFLSWFIAILLKDIPNHHLLSTKLSNLFQLKGNYILFIIINLLLGALLGGLSGWCGCLFSSTNNLSTNSKVGE